MTMQGFVNTAKKHDRPIVTILTAAGVLITSYLAMAQKINALIKDTPCIKAIEQANAVQDNEMKNLREMIAGLAKTSENLVSIHMKNGR